MCGLLYPKAPGEREYPGGGTGPLGRGPVFGIRWGVQDPWGAFPPQGENQSPEVGFPKQNARPEAGRRESQSNFLLRRAFLPRKPRK